MILPTPEGRPRSIGVPDVIMKYTECTADDVRQGITPEIQRAADRDVEKMSQDMPLLTGLGASLNKVAVAGIWLKQKLLDDGMHQALVENIAFNFGRACLGRDPFEVAAKNWNRYRDTLPEPGTLADNEQVYDEQIAPLMTKIIGICKENKLPFLAVFQYQPEGMCSTCIADIEGAHRVFKHTADMFFGRDKIAPKKG